MIPKRLQQQFLHRACGSGHFVGCTAGLFLGLAGALSPTRAVAQEFSFRGNDVGFPVQPTVEYLTSIAIPMESLPSTGRWNAWLEIRETNADFNHELETLTLYVGSMSPRTFAFAADNGEIDRSLAVSIPVDTAELFAWIEDGRLDLWLETSSYVNQSQGMGDAMALPSFLSARLLMESVPEPAGIFPLAVAACCWLYRVASRGIRIA